MSGCQCLHGDDGDDDVVLLKDWRRLTARKPHVCGPCGRAIPQGAEFFFAQTRDTRAKAIYTFIECVGCADLAGHFWCEEGYPPSDGRADILAEILADQEEDGQESSMCCYDGLSPAALEVLEDVVWPKVEKLTQARGHRRALRRAEHERQSPGGPMSPLDQVCKCEYCNAYGTGAPPPGWRQSYFKECGGHPIYYCPAPGCQEAEDLSVAVHKAAWEAPEVNTKYDTWEAWITAALPLLRHEGFIRAEEGVEGLEAYTLGGMREAFAAGETPAQAIREEMGNAC